MSNPEQLNPGTEQLPNPNQASEQAAERLKDRFEKSGETINNKSERLESARVEAKAAFSRESGKESKRPANSSGSASAIKRVTKSQRNSEYKRTLQRAQSNMPLPSRTFSKLIHNPVIEKTSDLAAATVARPNAILMGGLSSFILVGAVYLIAKHYGYALSGFETMATFALGWIIGLIIDYARLMITSRR